MISKPEKIIKRIIKAVGQRQAVLVIGDWQDELIKGIRENQNSITTSFEPFMSSSGLTRGSSYTKDSNILLDSRFRGNDNKYYEDNSFTRVVADYSLIVNFTSEIFFKEIRRLLLPTGMVIISANCENGILDKLIRLFKKDHIKEEGIKKIKPKILQDQIHDNGFLIDGYYGYPGGHLLMMANIINKEVSTLFTSDTQETIKN